MGTKYQKAKNKQKKKTHTKFCGEKDKKANIYLQQEMFQAFATSDFLSLFSLAILSPFYWEISNILPFHNTLESERIIASSNQDKFSI